MPDPLHDARRYTALMDAINRASLKKSLRIIFGDIPRTVRILAARPSRILAGARIILHRKNAARARNEAGAGELDVPVMMFISITDRCNLSCHGCYLQERKTACGPEMGLEELKTVVGQAEDLGIAVVGFVGGEPLLRKDTVISLARSFPRILFTLSTNGLLIDEGTAEELAGCGNLVPFVSLEGFRAETDLRRGSGVYDQLIRVFSLLEPRVLFFGCAVTVTRQNIDEVLGEPFIRAMIAAGARAFIFIQFIPAAAGSEDLVLSPGQRELVIRKMEEFSRQYPAFFFGVPGDMELFGGCLAAGRGFIHVSSRGDLEPCPLVPVSDANLRTRSLKEALQSPILRAIRRNYRSLHANGRCVLRTQPRWLEEQGSLK
jgi:MoaA/NifB/PqqE/SkfB family radical SAM enzyme